MLEPQLPLEILHVVQFAAKKIGQLSFCQSCVHLGSELLLIDVVVTGTAGARSFQIWLLYGIKAV